jgi:dTDP-4-amino-4,6-dideoxygalactose transaminase
VEVPEEGPGEFCVFQTYVIKAARRDELKKYLNERGVEALIHYATPIHLQPAAKELGYKAEDFPRTMLHVGKILSLPLYPTLTHKQQDQIVELVASFYKST